MREYARKTQVGRQSGCRECACFHSAQERFIMSFRNGDRSRENRLRRAKILRRLKTQQIRESSSTAATKTKPGK